MNEQEERFLKELSELTRRYGIYISSEDNIFLCVDTSGEIRGEYKGYKDSIYWESKR